jgi:putative ABC transport system permease protein
MIRNFLKIAFRTMLKSKAHTAINITGLAVGLACTLLILIWVQYELSIDAWHKDSDRVFQVYEIQNYDNAIEGVRTTPALLAAEIKRVIPEVELATPMMYNQWHNFRVGDKILTLKGGYAGADYFSIFNIKMLEGSSRSALNTLSGIAISKKMADQFFGSTQTAMGKSLRFNNDKDFVVTAVFEDLPENTSRKFEYLISWEELLTERPWLKQWGAQASETYVMLRKTARANQVEAKLKHFLDNYNREQQQGSFKIELGLQGFNEVYLHGNFANGKVDGGRIEYVWLFSVIAFFILVIACINFMNLTTARSVKRAREIGVRKVLGALRSVLIRQFIGESMLLTVMAVIIALLLLLLLLPAFNGIIQQHIALPFNKLSFWIGLMIITLVTGFISGSYPALFLSSFNPVKVLQGTSKIGKGAAAFRNGLVVFQFVISIVLIIGTIVIARQINFIRSKNLGYDRNNLIYMPLTGELQFKYALLKEKALNMPGIQSITHSSEAPTGIENEETDVQWAGKAPNFKSPFTIISAGYDFVNTMKIQLLAGRDHSKVFPTDSSGFLINEAALKSIGYAEGIGQPLTVWGEKGSIVGVIKDFHFSSMHDPIKPLIIRFGENERSGSALVRALPGQTKQTLGSLEELNKQLNPEFPFNYTFSDEEYANLYQAEQVIGKLAGAFSFLSIFLSCLGLLGQVIFMTELRTKEIGIRKVLGAGTGSLLVLLTGEFMVLIIVALLIACPVAWFAMHKWLQNFAYHTTVQWWIFVVAALIAFMITLLTITVQSVKAVLLTPVKSLRN